VLKEITIMKRLRNRLATTALLTTAIIGSVGAQMNGTPREKENTAQRSATAGRPMPGPHLLANGVYAVLREGLARAEAQSEKGPHVELVYDRK
jgi:hypothetical protein